MAKNDIAKIVSRKANYHERRNGDAFSSSENRRHIGSFVIDSELYNPNRKLSRFRFDDTTRIHTGIGAGC